MATRLTQILSFTNVGAGQQASLPHQLNVSGRAVVPDIVFRSNGAFTIVSADDEQVTVENTSGGPADCDVWIQYQHSHDRWFGGKGTQQLTPAPFIPAAGGGGGGGGGLPTFEMMVATGVAVGSTPTVVITPGQNYQIPSTEKLIFNATLWIEYEASIPPDPQPVWVHMYIIKDFGTKGQTIVTEAIVQQLTAQLGAEPQRASMSLTCMAEIPGDDLPHSYTLWVAVDPAPQGGEHASTVQRANWFVTQTTL